MKISLLFPRSIFFQVYEKKKRERPKKNYDFLKIVQ